ncbi:MAG: saccharopine dehydrogenase NADP-binding domain-containing protein [Burkholderiales bacterium]
MIRPMGKGLVALLGATGYTGRLVAAELARGERPYRLGARDARRLAEVSRAAHGESCVVDAKNAAGLDALLNGAEVLINTVGPFTELGLPVVEAAVRNGVAYVDSTGEPGFMADVYRRFAAAPVAIVPACGFDYIPGDLAAALAARDLGGKCDRIDVHYETNAMLPSRGTVRSGLGVLAQGGARALQARRVTLPEGVRNAIEWPGGERVTVPLHVPGTEVCVTMIVPGPLLPGWQLGAAGIAALAPLLRPFADFLPEGPPAVLRAVARYRVYAEASGPAGRAMVLCEGSDPYGMTARFLVAAAARISGTGAMAPAQALEPAAFLDALSGADFRWRRLEPARQ